MNLVILVAVGLVAGLDSFAVSFVVAGAVPRSVEAVIAAAVVELLTVEFAVLVESDERHAPAVAGMPVAVAAVFVVVVVVTAVAVAAVVAVDTEAVVSAVGTAVSVVEVVVGPALELEVLELVELFESEWVRAAPV